MHDTLIQLSIITAICLIPQSEYIAECSWLHVMPFSCRQIINFKTLFPGRQILIEDSQYLIDGYLKDSQIVTTFTILVIHSYANIASLINQAGNCVMHL